MSISIVFTTATLDTPPSNAIKDKIETVEDDSKKEKKCTSNTQTIVAFLCNRQMNNCAQSILTLRARKREATIRN